MELHPHIPLIGLRDAFLTTPEHAPLVEKVMSEKAREHFGCSLTVKVKACDSRGRLAG
jgi:hypothetical protein